MFLITYLATIVFVGALGLWVYHLVEQRVDDVQTISRLRRKVRDLESKVEDLESQNAMLRVF
jgi:cell division protein FtsB